MEDAQIVRLYWQREESAISETDSKYGGLCRRIAMNVLNNRQDAEESVSDTYLAAWNAIPPSRPAVLSAFLSKLTRRIAIDHWRHLSAKKRGGGQVTLCLDELGDCVSGQVTAEEAAIGREARDAMNRFLEELPKQERMIFLRRYFFFDPVPEIAEAFGFTESKVNSLLFRTRKKLYARLSKEGYV